MFLLNKTNQHAWLWWIAIISLSIGLSIFILLEPGDHDYDVQRYRSMALVISLLISGLCIIIGTQRRWFGKDL